MAYVDLVHHLRQHRKGMGRSNLSYLAVELNDGVLIDLARLRLYSKKTNIMLISWRYLRGRLPAMKGYEWAERVVEFDKLKFGNCLQCH